MILKRAGDNFGGRSGTFVNQNDNRQAFDNVAFFGGVFNRIAFVAGAGGNDFALVQKQIGNADRLIKQPSWVVADVENNAGQFAVGFLAGIFDRFFNHFINIFRKRGNADISNVAALDFALDGLDFDFLAFEGNVKRLFAGTANGQFDFGADLAAHFVDGFVQGKSHNLFAVNTGNVIARFQSRLGGRRVVNRRNNLDDAVFHGNFYAQTAEFSGSLLAHVFKALFVEIAGMRIQRNQHAVNCRLNQFPVRNFFNI